MNTKIIKNILLNSFLFLFTQLKAHAQGIPNECAIVTSGNQAFSIVSDETNNFNFLDFGLYTNVTPRMCKDLKSLGESMQIVSGILTPLAAIAADPSVRAALSAQAVALGITMANPIVLSIVVFGGMGINTMYFIYQKTKEECANLEKQELKKQIFEELKSKFKLQPAGDVEMSIEIEF